MKNADMPANPCVNEHGAPIHHSNAGVHEGCMTGLTKREMFTMHAMQNILGRYNPFESGDFDSSDYEAVAIHSVGLADAVLNELEKVHER